MSNAAAPRTVISYSMFALGVFIALLLLPEKGYWFYLINPLVAISQGITAPNLNTVVSLQASADRQGEVMGINQSMLSLGQTAPPLIAGYLNTISVSLPIAAASVFILAAWLVYVGIFRRKGH
jgi:DHA1 family tetracycline resistance protein-like MFS transporter